MTILYLASVVDIPRSDHGGLGGTSHVIEVSRNLIQQGLDVVVFCRGKGFGNEWFEYEDVRIRRFFRGISVSAAYPPGGAIYVIRQAIRTPFLWGTRLAQSVVDAVSIVKWARRNNVDVIYERVNRFSVAGTIASKMLGVPFVAEVNDLNFHEISIKRASAIVVPEPQSLKPEFRDKSFGLSWGVDTERIRPDSPCQELKSILGIGDEPIVLFVGSFLPWHGAVSIVKAAPEVCEAHPGVKFLMIGTGPDETRTRDEIRRKGLEAHFVFTGYVPFDDISRHLSIGDVMVAPYTSELGAQDGRAEMGRSFKVLEYMAAGKAVVVTKVANRGGAVQHGETGLVVEDDEPEALAQAISCLLRNKTRAAAMGQKGRQIVKERYTWRSHAEAIKDIFESVVSAR